MPNYLERATLTLTLEIDIRFSIVSFYTEITTVLPIYALK